MLKSFLRLALVLSLSSTTVHAQVDLWLEEPSSRLDSLRELLPQWNDTITPADLDIALEIRKSSRRYAINHHVYTHIVRCALDAGQPELAERYSRELFPVFQLLRLSRKRLNRGIECRNLCSTLSDYYYAKGNLRRGNHFRKLTLTRFVARFCGTVAKQADHRLMLQLIEGYEEAGQKLKAKHWQRKAKRFHRRHLV